MRELLEQTFKRHKMMVIDNEFAIGQVVFLKTDKEQLPRIVTAIKVHKDGELVYELSQAVSISNHYTFELQTDKNIELTVS